MLKSIFIICIGLSVLSLAIVGQASADKLSIDAAEHNNIHRTDFTELKHAGQGRVLQIIDPRTITLDDGRIIRMVGIDIPDFDLDNPGDISLQVIRILNDLLLGKQVKIWQTRSSKKGRTNRIGHQLAHITSEDKDIWVQALLIRLGLARVQTTKNNPELAEALYRLETEARSQQAGLWSMSEHVVLQPAEADNYMGEFEIVEGIVTSASINKNRIYLNFGKDWRTDFTASIAPSDRKTFNKAGYNPLQWQGRKLRLRGWIEPYNGPYIEVTHPEAVEFLD